MNQNTRPAALSRSSGVPFIKMHGAGNDFVVIDSRGCVHDVQRELVVLMGDRRRGVGFDQLAELLDSDATGVDLRLRFWNADGSLAEACGNATRCVASLLFEEDASRAGLKIQTPRGILSAERREDQIWVDMGAPLFGWEEIPLARPLDARALPIAGQPDAVSIGNPHCVFFVEDADCARVEELGPLMENDGLFPARTNVEFVSLVSENVLRMRVWERGTGVTLACGSGACAAAVCAYHRGLTDHRTKLLVDGGELEVDWCHDSLWLTGPVCKVFSGMFLP
ncbi:diaminopimelate epimerase [Hoeflea marina]|uniref:Diaminopimelate epimerase n=1 Tax=Hoeflea marina TaxID=274592 RepID=A0A317PET0_9HYPH|nr:diaminopimelate epimerase [Hoeflea marina]PWV97096.1 diaminopimelate epimerase [Hoeflea marina]